MSYSFADHLHNYSVWTSARAVQRGFTTTENIKSAIDNTQLRKLVEVGGVKTLVEFDNFHRSTAKIIIQHLTEMNIPTSYGRAAKIIAVYLKTSVVIRDSGESILSKIIHPPIDNILLTNLAKENKGMGLENIKWTQLSEKEYFELMRKLQTIHHDSFWKLEKYWTPIQG